jgi:hypothetical protein
MSVREPGLFRIDTRTRSLAPMRGGEGLMWPKCRWQGGILAAVPAGGATGGRIVARLFWPDQAKVDAVLDCSGYPNWTRDGKAVIGANDAARRIERYSLDTGRAEPILDTTSVRRTGLSIGPWVGLAPDDAPLVLLSHDTWELYALDWEAP